MINCVDTYGLAREGSQSGHIGVTSFTFQTQTPVILIHLNVTNGLV